MPHTDTDLPNCPGQHRDDDVKGQPVWCHDHAQRISNALSGLPDAYRELATTQALDTGRREILRAPSPEPASPSRRVDLADEILHTVCAWEDALRQHLGHPGAGQPAIHTSRALDNAVAYLGRMHTAALSTPFADDYGHEITRLARTADRLLGTGDEPEKPTRIRVTGPCPDCGNTNLHRIDGRDQVCCSTHRCPLNITYDEYLAHMWWLAQTYQGAA